MFRDFSVSFLFDFGILVFRGVYGLVACLETLLELRVHLEEVVALSLDL